MDTSRISLPKISDNTYEAVKHVLSLITEIFIEGLKEAIKDKLNIDLLEKENENNPEISMPVVLMIKGSVTEMNPGSRSLGIWGGVIARVQIRGEILDANTKTTLLKFRHSHESPNRFSSYRKILIHNALEVSEHIGEMLMIF